MKHPLNQAMRSIVEAQPDRTATADLLAAEIAAGDLWRRPSGGGHPDPWDLEVWVRSEFGRHVFSLERGRIAVREQYCRIERLVEGSVRGGGCEIRPPAEVARAAG
jgi:hypothetical protein